MGDAPLPPDWRAGALRIFSALAGSARVRWMRAMVKRRVGSVGLRVRALASSARASSFMPWAARRLGDFDVAGGFLIGGVDDEVAVGEAFVEGGAVDAVGGEIEVGGEVGREGDGEAGDVGERLRVGNICGGKEEGGGPDVDFEFAGCDVGAVGDHGPRAFVGEIGGVGLGVVAGEDGEDFGGRCGL